MEVWIEGHLDSPFVDDYQGPALVTLTQEDPVVFSVSLWTPSRVLGDRVANLLLADSQIFLTRQPFSVRDAQRSEHDVLLTSLRKNALPRQEIRAGLDAEQMTVELRGSALEPGEYWIVVALHDPALANIVTIAEARSGLFAAAALRIVNEGMADQRNYVLYRRAMLSSSQERAMEAMRSLLKSCPDSAVGFAALGATHERFGDATGRAQAYAAAIATLESGKSPCDTKLMFAPNIDELVHSWRGKAVPGP